ncbi:MAG TPA: formimidoylglutamate deiminase, partial [Deltaproteobacteria bacterium]|nr:formimidoylglutamate deiminase [Deltaproteobacteria bacterium]
LLYGKTGDSLLDSWIFSGNVPVIRDVYVGGREVVSEGSHVEEDRIEEAFLQTMKRILC